MFIAHIWFYQTEMIKIYNGNGEIHISTNLQTGDRYQIDNVTNIFYMLIYIMQKRSVDLYCAAIV